MAATKAKTINDFRALHDANIIVPNKIKAALAAMLKEGAEQWDYEGDFMKRAAISQTQVGTFREQFLAHIVDVPSVSGRQGRRIWVADPKVAKKLRGE